ncbi:hypothetical protein JXA48_00980 [Candidatus Woesearchaeota archaeon]|nr:hypothetical protein [Candidatus Woesearchaeota archaeon]
MEETFEQKVIRNVQGNFAVYKTSEVVGSKSIIPNLEWVESEEVDKFFAFARNLGAKVVYVAEGEEEDENGNTKTSIVQVGFMHQGVMHHINLAEDESDNDEYEYEDESEDENEDTEEIVYDQKLSNSQNEYNQQQRPNPNPQNFGGDFIAQGPM